MPKPKIRPILLPSIFMSPISATNPSSISFAYNTEAISFNSYPNKKRSPFECVICLSSFTVNIPHGTKKCNHEICRACVRLYFQGALKDKRYKTYEFIHCPSIGCKQDFITDNVLFDFFTKAEIKRWWSTAITNAYMRNQIYCPMADCKAIFEVNDSLTRRCAFIECYECHRGFCVACQSPWHPGKIIIFDDEFEVAQTLEKAQQNLWCRCPKCSCIIEKTSGCSTIKCFCGTMFCYRCGGISDNHSCRNRCQFFNEEKLIAIRNTMFVYKKDA